MGKADIHIHTRYSDAWMKPEEVVDHVVSKTDLDVIAITDHDRIDGAIIAAEYAKSKQYTRPQIIIGSEISSLSGHILGLFLNEKIPSRLSTEETINAIHEQGGLAIAAHPYSFALRFLGMFGVGNHICSKSFDAIEVRNGSPTELFSNYFSSYINARYQKLPETGGSDAHHLITIGKSYTYFEGMSIEDFRRSLISNTIRPKGRVLYPIEVFQIIFMQLYLRRQELSASAK